MSALHLIPVFFLLVVNNVQGGGLYSPLPLASYVVPKTYVSPYTALPQSFSTIASYNSILNGALAGYVAQPSAAQFLSAVPQIASPYSVYSYPSVFQPSGLPVISPFVPRAAVPTVIVDPKRTIIDPMSPSDESPIEMNSDETAENSTPVSDDTLTTDSSE